MKIDIYPKDLLEALWQEQKKQFAPEAAQPPLCLRCGRPLDKHLMVNALSRHINVHICRDCGTDEALLDASCHPLSFMEWHAITSGYLDMLLKRESPVLTPLCSFKDIFKDTGSSSGQNAGLQAREIAYSRSDYDGHRWWSTWFPRQEERTAPPLVEEIDQFHNALFELAEFKTLGTLRLLCRSAEATTDPHEYNLYSETEHFYIWLRVITRPKDYNLYVHYYTK